MFNFGSWFLCHISSNTWFLENALFTPQKLENKKIVNGVFVTDKIFVFTDAMIFPFITFVTNTPLGEKMFLDSEKMSSKYLTSYFGYCRWPNIWFVLREFLSYFYPSFKVCKWVSQRGIGNTWPDHHFFKAKIPSNDPVTSITNWYHLILRKWETKFRNP